MCELLKFRKTLSKIFTFNSWAMSSYNKIILFVIVLPLFTASIAVGGLQTAYGGDPDPTPNGCENNSECSFLNDACVVGVCNAGECVLDTFPDGQQCGIGDVCNDQVCQDGECVLDPKLDGQQCGLGDECNDDVCQGGECVLDPIPLDGQSCGSSVTCNFQICNLGSCDLFPFADGDPCGPGVTCNAEVCETGQCVLDPEGFEGQLCEDDGMCSEGDCIPQFASIHGMKFQDIDLDGEKDPEEPGLPGWSFNLECNNGETDSTVSMEDGSYWFTEIPGFELIECIVTEIVKVGWFPTTDNPLTVDIGAGQIIEDQDFGNALVLSVSKTWTFTDYNWDRICDDLDDQTINVDPTTGACLVGFRDANINFNGEDTDPDDDVLADPLPITTVDEVDKFTAFAQLHKKGLSNTNPGAFYALTTVVINTSLSKVTVWEDYSDCFANQELIKFVSKDPTRNVKVAVADPSGDITELTERLYDESDSGVKFEDNEDPDDVSAHIEITDESHLTEGSTLYALVKFKNDLKGEDPNESNGVFDVMCINWEDVDAEVNTEVISLTSAHADLRITNDFDSDGVPSPDDLCPDMGLEVTGFVDEDGCPDDP